MALFWAFAADTTDPKSAKRGFPLVVAIGQMGGIVFPYSIGGLPYRLGCSTDTLSMVLLGLMTLLIIPLIRYFLRATPNHLLSSFDDKSKEKDQSKEAKSKDEAGFFEGLKLLLRHRYLLCIFGANFIYEVTIAIFDFNFKLAASSEFSGVALSRYY